MGGTLFNSIVFGPIKSRRLGHSLGINLLPTDSKLCNYNCIYCECGWNVSYTDHKADLPAPCNVVEELDNRLCNLFDQNLSIDVITFAGNGEPTLHPNFPEIMDLTIALRNKHYPKCKIAVLSNGTQLKREKISNALRKADLCILKLDAGNEKLFQRINQPVSNVTLSDITSSFSQFKGEIILQSLFFNGTHNGEEISNISSYDIEEWLQKVKQIQPSQVMIYTLDRETPMEGLQKVRHKDLIKIAHNVQQLDIDVSVSD